MDHPNDERSVRMTEVGLKWIEAARVKVQVRREISPVGPSLSSTGARLVLAR